MEFSSEGCWFKSVQIFLLEGYWFKSSEHSKSLNTVNTNKKILHLSSLLLYSTIISQKINHLFSFQKFSSTEIVPPHSPSTTLHMRTFNAATQKKGLHSQSLPVFVGLSLLISLWRGGTKNIQTKYRKSAITRRLTALLEAIALKSTFLGLGRLEPTEQIYLCTVILLLSLN